MKGQARAGLAGVARSARRVGRADVLRHVTPTPEEGGGGRLPVQSGPIHFPRVAARPPLSSTLVPC